MFSEYVFGINFCGVGVKSKKYVPQKSRKTKLIYSFSNFYTSFQTKNDTICKGYCYLILISSITSFVAVSGNGTPLTTLTY